MSFSSSLSSSVAQASSQTAAAIGAVKDLPLASYANEFRARLNSRPFLLEAEPGAGKSTLAPLWTLLHVLQQEQSAQQVWVIQPRVLAAQALAQRLATLMNSRCGDLVGYQVPYDNCSNNNTRLLLMTPGILLQHLLHRPTLDGVGAVLLDEVHERAVNQDLAWALLQEAQILREDLQLVLMSATPDPTLQQQLEQRLFAPGRCYPVETRYSPVLVNDRHQSESLPAHLLRVLDQEADWQTQTVLVFLPGWRDIEACTQALAERYPHHAIMRLHSKVSNAEQALALDPAQGPRLILATNIAETSLTIADVTLVIDSGLVRRANYEQRTGVTRLQTVRISQASADQRRGRAGRVQAGRCIRLWSKEQPLAPADLPEIRTCDHLPVALQLAHWGTRANDLNWLEPPNRLALQQAQQQLQLWGLITAEGKITARGIQVSELGTHPRIAVLLQSAVVADLVPRQLMLVALALHFDLPVADDLDSWLITAARELQRHPHWRAQQRRWLSALKVTEQESRLEPNRLARAFNDRIGFRQDSGRYRLNSGISVSADNHLGSQWAVFLHVQAQNQGRDQSHRGVALPLQLTSDEQRQFSQCTVEVIYKQQRWQRLLSWQMGGVIIAEEQRPIPADEIGKALIEHVQAQIAQKGLMGLKWPTAAISLLARARLLAKADVFNQAPALTDEALVDSLELWLQPFLTEHTRLDALPLLSGLEFYLGYDRCQQIAKLLPEKLTLPSGRTLALSFSAEGVPEISAKLQEFFGCENLQLAGGKIPLRIHLLAPNGSSLAITTNLHTFWQQAYPEVRKQMRGRYPRHPWPENPLEHVATALTKRRLQQLQ
jgi:ATP-dependent helicase HrpB